MSVIVELSLPSDAFELGRILCVEGGTQISLETVVPLGGKPTPFVRVQNNARTTFEETVRDHPSVNSIESVSTHDDETLYTLDWDPSKESLFRTIRQLDGVLLDANGSADTWALELRFPTHEALSEFREYYAGEEMQVTVNRIYNPTNPDAGPWYGLTPPQRKTLTYAVESGYYSLPRGISTKELAEEFDISDQAVTERLRRGITVLVQNTLLTVEEDE